MNSKEDSSVPLSAAAAALRKRAEVTLRETTPPSEAQLKALSPEEAQRLIHDLRVHQIELVMQNEELRRAQVALELSQASYFDLYDLAPVGYGTVSAKGLLLQSNLTLATLLGVPRGALVTQRLSRFVHAECTDRYYLLFKQVLQTGEPQSAELRLVKSDGTECWAQLTATRAEDEGGAPVLRFTLSDITNRKQAETALQEHDAFNASVLDSVADHIAVLNPESVILFVNRAWRQFAEDNSLPHHAVEPVGQNYLQVCENAPKHPNGAEAAAVQAGLEAVLSGAQLDFKLEYPCHSPTEQRWFLMTITRLVGAQSGIVVSHKNITTRKQVEEALRLSEARTGGIVASAMDAIISVDAQQRVLLFNAAAEKMFGFRAVEVLGETLERFIPQRHQSGHHHHVEKFGQGGVTNRAMGALGVISGVRANGEEFPLEASISHVGSGAEKILTVILRDVTERKRAEAAREAMESQLRQSQKLEALGTLAGGIAHDFNNILAGISGFSTLARGAISNPVELIDYLGEIDRAGKRAAKLIEQILSFSRADNHTLVPMQLRHVVAEAAQLLRATLPTTIEFSVALASDLPLVQGNATQLHQVMMNLGTNSAHALRERGGRLSIKLDVCAVPDLRADDPPDLRAGPCVRLTVEDTGCGMDAATQARVFEPFFTTKGVGEGTGLGLSVLHGIVRGHHGAIRMNSEVGRGTTFEIFLPALTEVPLASLTAASEEIPRGKGERILYVDDEETLTRLGVLTLRQLGYTAESESRVLDALARFERDPGAFDLVITDYTMPLMTGLKFAERLHALRPDLPVIVTSGNSMKFTLKAIQTAGVAEVLEKPYSNAALAGAIHRQLSSKRPH